MQLGNEVSTVLIAVLVSLAINLLFKLWDNFLYRKTKQDEENRSWFYDDIDYFCTLIDEVKESSISYYKNSSGNDQISDKILLAQNMGKLHGLSVFIDSLSINNMKTQKRLNEQLVLFRKACTSDKDGAESVDVITQIANAGFALISTLKTARREFKTT